MAYLVDGFYKKTPRPAEIALRIFLSLIIKNMSNDHEVQELLREFRERGLQNLMSNLVLHPPMQTCSTRNKFKVEVHSKWNEERHNLSAKTPKDLEMYPPGSAEWR